MSLLYKAAVSLIKMEESCAENFLKLAKVSDSFRAKNYVTHFANCRESMSCILVQIITFYYDEYFLRKFSQYLAGGLSEE